MDFCDRRAPHHFTGALRVFDVHPEQRLNDDVETAARELSHFRLLLVQDSALKPTGANYAIRLTAPTHQVMKRTRWAGTIGVHIANQVPQWSKFQSFDQGAALADGFGKIQKTDEGKIGRNFLDDATCV